MFKTICVFGGGLLLLLPLFAGCGQKAKNREANRDPASGSVTFDGKPLPGGTITFISVKDPNYTSTAMIRDGHFSVDNAPTGDVRVAVETESMHSIQALYIPIPSKYCSVATSGLTGTVVKGGADGTKLTFDLKSK